MQNSILSFELKVLLRRSQDWMNAAGFLFLYVSLFAISLAHISIGHIIWDSIILFAMLFTSLYLTDGNIRQEYHECSLQNIVVSTYPVWIYFTIKFIVQWLGLILPILLVAPVIILITNYDFEFMLRLVLVLLLSSPTLVIFSMLASIMTLPLQRTNFLLTLIIMPLYLPIILLAISALQSGLFPWMEASLLLAMSIGSVTIVPHFIALIAKETVCHA